MARFDDASQYFDPGLTLTVLGKEYTLPLPSAELAMWCRAAIAVGSDLSEASSDDDIADAAKRAAERVKELPELEGETPLHLRLMGHVHQQMVDDRVPDPYIQFCLMTAYLWVAAGEAVAERYWTSGGRPEALGPGNRAERRAAARTGGSSAAAANVTPSPGSTSGTTSTTTSKPRSRGRRRSRSRGQRS